MDIHPDQLNTHKSESLVRLVPELGGLPGQARNNFYEINKINCLQDKHDVTL
jgi:hypothetical protein